MLRRVLLLVLPFFSLAAGAAGTLKPFTVFQVDADQIEQAIAKAQAQSRPETPVSGITVPHHLLAADLVARGFWSATGGGARDRIIILTPDHFNRATRSFATTPRNFQTVFGQVPGDASAVETLLARKDLFESSELFEKEHGLQALLPFVAKLFPGVPVVPVAISYSSSRRDWDEALKLLRPLATDRTLIVQSTDFSHYLPLEIAIQRDQETLNMLASGDIDALAAMRQPDHMDSLGAQYLQMRLQDQVYGARPLVVANENSQHYLKAKVQKTTSYIVQVYCTPQQVTSTPCRASPGGKTFFFAGDTLLGRNFLPLLANKPVKRKLLERIRNVTGGAPMIVNLEGVVVDEIPRSRHATAMVMPHALTIDWLKDMNVVAVSLANNHSMDFGPEAYQQMVQALEAAGIRCLSHGDVADMGALRIWALSDFGRLGGAPFVDRIQPKDLEPARLDGVASPVVAFVHWGREGNSEPGARELMLANMLRQRGVAAVIGAHSHRASHAIHDVAGGESQMLYSLGNFLFDQPAGTGALLEVIVFDQGTIFTRLRPLPKLYDVARAMAITAR